MIRKLTEQEKLINTRSSYVFERNGYKTWLDEKHFLKLQRECNDINQPTPSLLDEVKRLRDETRMQGGEFGKMNMTISETSSLAMVIAYDVVIDLINKNSKNEKV